MPNISQLTGQDAQDIADVTWRTAAGTSLRSSAVRAADALNVHDFGAVGDGVTDDSAAFVLALAAGAYVVGRQGCIYKIKNLTLSNNQTIDGRGVRFKSAAGATWMFKLTNYAAEVCNLYVSDASTCSEAAVIFDDGRFCKLDNWTILNAVNVVKLKSSAAVLGTQCVKPIIRDGHAETFTGIGLDVGPNVAQEEATDLFLDSGTTAGTPRASAYGVKHVSTGTVSGNTYGGHTYTNVRCEGMQHPWYIKDATLVEIIGGWGDTAASYAIDIAGTSDHINVYDFFVGTSMGVRVSDSAKANFLGLETTGTGVVPSWGVGQFYDTAGPYCDLTATGTADVTVDLSGWRGAKALSIASSVALTLNGGDFLTGATVGTVAGGATTYLGRNAQQATETDTTFRMPYNGYLLGLAAYCSAAPGVGETFAYTPRLAGVDTALTCSIGGAATFGASAFSAIYAAAGTAVTVAKLVASGGAAATRHQVNLRIASL